MESKMAPRTYKIITIIMCFIVNFFVSHPALASVGCGDTLKKVQNKNSNLSNTELIEFFQTFSPICLKGAEFSEWGNELLFSVLEKQPVEFALVLEKQDKNKIVTILSTLESPVNDVIDIKAIYASVKSLNVNSQMKQKIMQSLQIAGSKNGMVLK